MEGDVRILHLADLHLGKIVNGFSMLEDQAYMLRQIMSVIQNERPQAVIIAGDVYDRAMPGVEAVKIFDQFLTELVREKVAVIVISGNHDSAERLSFASRIMMEQQVYIYTIFDGSVHTVALQDEFGTVVFHLLPFVRPAEVRPFFEKKIESYSDALKTVLESIKKDPADRNILIAHQFVAAEGLEPERSDSENISLGGLDCIDVEMLEGFDYVALGHLHGSQKVAYDHIRYCGSPLKYSFSEVHHIKSVCLLEIGDKKSLSVTTVPLIPLRDMRKIKGPLNALMSKTVVEQGNKEDYLHITLTDEEEIVDAIGKVRSVYPHVMILTFENSRTRAIFDLEEEIKIEDVSPVELFSSFYVSQNGGEMKRVHKEIVKNVLEQIGEQI
jgi:exonuclease SbcD